MTDNQDLSYAVSAVNAVGAVTAVGAVRPNETLMAVAGTNGGLDAPNVCRDFLRKVTAATVANFSSVSVALLIEQLIGANAAWNGTVSRVVCMRSAARSLCA
ncbi:hypothetical protein V5799_015939 [Amblyomma americanum]|uniref:Uncharacterized protein n=1 Tax=Amblyomma americanum TaxID=6943 RepID=A0AAQ4F7J9_AMBAM